MSFKLFDVLGWHHAKFIAKAGRKILGIIISNTVGKFRYPYIRVLFHSRTFRFDSNVTYEGGD